MQQDVLEREHKEYTVLKAVYDLSKPEQGRGVSEEDVAKYTGLSLAEVPEILERLLIYKLIGCPDYNSGYVSTLATSSKLLDYAKSVNQANTHVTNNFHASVGAVQYGDNNTANVNQTVDPNNTQILQVIAELRRQVSTLAVDKQSIANAAIDDIETAITNPTQVEKAKSSLWTLWGISQGIATFANAATAVAERFGVHFHS